MSQCRRWQVAALEGIGLTDALRGIKDAALESHKDVHVSWVEQKSSASARRLAVPGLQIACTAKVGDPRIVILDLKYQ